MLKRGGRIKRKREEWIREVNEGKTKEETPT
jgi:hypothetical protein